MLGPGEGDSGLIKTDGPKPVEPPIGPIIMCANPVNMWFVIRNNLTILNNNTSHLCKYA